MYKLIAFATLLSCLSLPTFAQSDRPVAKAGEPLDFGHMSDRQVNEFVASELKELNDQAALVRSALTILVTLQAAYALESDAAEPNQEPAIGEKLQRYFKRPLSKALEDLSTSSTANDLERASAFRVAPPSSTKRGWSRRPPGNGRTPFPCLRASTPWPRSSTASTRSR